MKNKVPKLRFPEFSGEWEEKKFHSIFKIFNGYAFSSSDSRSNGIRWVKIADVGIKKMKEDSLSFLPFDYKKKYSNFLLNENDYVIALTRPILNNELKIAKVNNNFHNSLLNQRVGKLESNQNIDFVYQLLQKNNIVSKIEVNIAGSDPPNLSPKEINNLKTNIPSLPEQEKIANFLSSVDIKIEKLEKKKELLEKYKKGMIQKLFSQKLRFKDENGDDYPEWEEKKLGEIAKFSKGKNIAKIDISEEGFECIRYGELYTKYNEVIKEVTSKTNLKETDLIFSEIGDIIIPASGETAIDLATASCILKKGIALGGDINIIKTKENGIFLSYYMNNSKKYEIASLAQGISVIHIYNSQLGLLKLSLPSLPEQEKIANFLSSIDRKIELIEQELEKNKEFKKGLLQQMFV